MGKSAARKQPKAAARPDPRKHPKAKAPTVHDGPLAWRFSECDRGGDWAWTKLSDPALYKDVMEKLYEFECKNWDEIRRNGSHPILVGDIAKAARKRLRTLYKDDVDELMSFRISGSQRVWCLRQLNVMKILWWDPDHKVCPAAKKHT